MVAENVRGDFLDRPLLNSGVVTCEKMAWLALVAVAGLTRLVNLGMRAMSHDESMHAYYSYLLYDTGSYKHDPALHGPLLFHLNAFVYLLVGDSDFTARLVPALSGCALILALYALRRYLGRWGALSAATLAVVSPSLLFISRYLVIDVPVLLFSLAWTYGAFRYLEERRSSWLYLITAAMALSTAAKANAFIFGAIAGSFLLVLVVLGGLSRTLPAAGRGAADLSVLMFTLALPFLSPLVHLALGWGKAVFTLTDGLARSLCLVLLNALAAVVIAGLFFGKTVRKQGTPGPLDFALWLRLMAFFWIIQVLLFTTFFTNTAGGLASGIIGSLSYWLEQHGVRRGGAPWFYYLVTGSLYEFLALSLALCAAVYLLRRISWWKQFAAEDVRTSTEGATTDAQLTPGFRNHRFLFGCFAMWWALGSWLAYSFAGERMPWLLVHMTFPTILLGGWWLGWLAESAAFKKAGWSGTIWLIPAVPVLGLLSSMLITTRPFTGRTLEAAALTVRWITTCALVLILAAFILRAVLRHGRAASLRALLLGIALPLVLITVRFSGMLNYRNYDLATELLVYAHATPDIKLTLSEVDAVMQRASDQDHPLVCYDDESTWPFAWYFRHHSGISFYGTTPDTTIAASPVVIVGPKNRARVAPLLGANYVKRIRRLIWWPTEDYYDLTPRAAWNVLTDRDRRQVLWQFLMYRRHQGVSLVEWPRRHEFDVYLRADAAARIWGSGLPGELAGTMAEPPECIPELTPLSVEVFDSVYGDARLKSPSGVAVSSQGTVVIADTGNDRVVVLDRKGRLVRTFGRRCKLEQGGAGGCMDEDGAGPLQPGDGQFLEPWGVAFSPSGRIFVADTWNSRIQAFDPGGRFLWKWGVFGSTAGIPGDPRLLYGPRGLAVTPDNELLVADTGNKRVLRFRESGELLGQAGGSGKIPGLFDEPVGIAVDPESGDILVADTWNRRIQRFSAGMRFLQEWHVPGWRSRDAASKPYLAVDSQGKVYATDPGESRLLAFDSTGRPQHFIRALGTIHGRLSRPTGVAVDTTDTSIWVSDSGNDRVVRLRLAAAAPNNPIGR